ncbi:MAG: hypothetical protein EVA67_09085 [OM182 bacterium]|jgi:hypothetical protein|nr:MAG: hypothetical protein EVA67_09085 [OM182 bacterium]HBK19655.1 hypothetical protein [Gammaproteobacteria bacterium]|tara:strand:- start:31 stop:771 length:741 start_codon:yes stop_codon:yes gene_type:complete
MGIQDSAYADKTTEQVLYELERKTAGNSAKAYAARSVIEENRALVLRNYAAAFLGDRHLAQQNTDDLFHSRLALLHAHSETTEQNELLAAAAKLQFVAHQSEMNNAIVNVSRRLVEINGALEEVNRTIDNLNVQINAFNNRQLAENERIIESKDVDPESELGESGFAQKLREQTEQLLTVARNYDGEVSTLLAGAAGNRSRLNEAYEMSMENRDNIIKNRDRLSEQQLKVLDSMGGVNAPLDGSTF